MRRFISLTLIASAVFVARPALAGPLSASATITGVADGSDFDYTIVLKNLSAGQNPDSIQTFWYAWTPQPADFLPTSPLSMTNPTGWTSIITHFPNVNTNGFAIQWKTSTNALAPGDDLIFTFKSADTPAQLAGNSPFYPGTPVGTSFVYSGQPLNGDPFEFVVQSVPEPASMTLTVIGAIGVFWRGVDQAIARGGAVGVAENPGNSCAVRAVGPIELTV